MGDNDSKAPGLIVWTPQQLNALRGLLIVMVVALAGRLICNRTFIDNPQPDAAARSDDLADKFDPNICTWQELAAIPGMGEKKAHSIVDYRDGWTKTHPDRPAFAGPQDLRKIKGIGPATVANSLPYLMFPAKKEITSTKPAGAN